TNGFVLSVLYRALGGAPAPLVKRGFQLSSLDKYLTKPMAVLSHLDDRDFLAQIEAVDRFVDGMHAYPGRTFGQLYHRFFRVNDLADGVLELTGRGRARARPAGGTSAWSLSLDPVEEAVEAVVELVVVGQRRRHLARRREERRVVVVGQRGDRGARAAPRLGGAFRDAERREAV